MRTTPLQRANARLWAIAQIAETMADVEHPHDPEIARENGHIWQRVHSLIQTTRADLRLLQQGGAQ